MSLSSQVCPDFFSAGTKKMLVDNGTDCLSASPRKEMSLRVFGTIARSEIILHYMCMAVVSWPTSAIYYVSFPTLQLGGTQGCL